MVAVSRALAARKASSGVCHTRFTAKLSQCVVYSMDKTKAIKRKLCFVFCASNSDGLIT